MVEYGPVTAVAGVDLDVPRGQVVGLLGPSGCGKSSLLRAIAGLEPLTAGQVRWDGQDMTEIPVHRRSFGLMFQDGQLFAHRSVAGNVAYGVQMARWSRQQRRRRVAELLELVGLTGFGPRAITELSGGERQRVALARALAPRPRLLLLDEPLSALDRALRERLTLELHDILRAAGTTALYVTHDHDEAFTVAHRVGLMRDGHLIQQGTPAQVWAEPADADVARFLGYSLSRQDGRLLAISPHAMRVLAAREGADGFPQGAAGEEVAEAVVRQMSFSRGRSLAQVQLADWGVQTAVVAPGLQLSEGQRVLVGIDSHAVLDFPAREAAIRDRN